VQNAHAVIPNHILCRAAVDGGFACCNHLWFLHDGRGARLEDGILTPQLVRTDKVSPFFWPAASSIVTSLSCLPRSLQQTQPLCATRSFGINSLAVCSQVRSAGRDPQLRARDYLTVMLRIQSLLTNRSPCISRHLDTQVVASVCCAGLVRTLGVFVHRLYVIRRDCKTWCAPQHPSLHADNARRGLLSSKLDALTLRIYS